MIMLMVIKKSLWIPYFVMEVLNILGMPGLFIITIIIIITIMIITTTPLSD